MVSAETIWSLFIQYFTLNKCYVSQVPSVYCKEMLYKKRIVRLKLLSDKSLIKIKKRIAERTEPCGTPNLIETSILIGQLLMGGQLF